ASIANNTRPMVERARGGAFCAASVARRIGSVGGRTQRHAVHIFRVAVADRLWALRGGAFDQALRMGRYHARSRINGQADASDVAFRDVVARLLAAGPFRPYFPQGSGYATL